MNKGQRVKIVDEDDECHEQLGVIYKQPANSIYRVKILTGATKRNKVRSYKKEQLELTEEEK